MSNPNSKTVTNRFQTVLQKTLTLGQAAGPDAPQQMWKADNQVQLDPAFGVEIRHHS